MNVIKATHSQENGRTIVNLRFKTKDQLLDPDDPCPPTTKEITQEAEDAILNNVCADPLKKPLTLEPQVPGVPDFESWSSDSLDRVVDSLLLVEGRDNSSVRA